MRSLYLHGLRQDVGWRSVPTQDPATCQHRNTDHRGSNDKVRNIYGKGCGTFIDAVAAGLAREIDARREPPSAEEQALLDGVAGHSTLSKEQVVAATELMLAEARQLEAGDYRLLDICNVFINCGDRVQVRPTALVATKEAKDDAPAFC